MGMACTRVAERVLASMGAGADAAPAVFEPSVDVAHGGVLAALPALVANGLFRHTEQLFNLPRGYYSAVHLFVALGLMMLARVKNVERLRYEPCGEWGRLLGLDRLPEARTMRGKIGLLAQDEAVREWSSRLSREWMESAPGMAGTLYVDGHVRVYHGSQTRQPRRYVSRERLCLRGLADYWVNDRIGSPFFVVSTPATDGLLAMLRGEIVPRLLKEVPGQPTDQELAANPHMARFTLVFDREGYSPVFMKEMWHQRIACLSYHKFPGDNWSESEFCEQTVELAHGASATMKLAERGTRLSNGLWVREVRKLTDSGHQVPLISTSYQGETSPLAGAMFARWSQENFFRYAIQHFDLDRLAGYMVEPVDETMKVVNPAWRAADAKVRTARGKLARKSVEFATLNLADDASEEETAKHLGCQANLREQIDLLEQDLDKLKQTRAATAKKIEIGQLPEAQRPGVLSPTKKLFLDTIRMIAWRAETAMATVVREKMARPGDARALLREIFATEADLVPNYEQRTLTVRLHHLTNNASDEAARHLFEHLNKTETLYPGTQMRMIYEMVSAPKNAAATDSNSNPNQEVLA